MTTDTPTPPQGTHTWALTEMALDMLTSAGYPDAAHVHDEMVVETDVDANKP